MRLVDDYLKTSAPLVSLCSVSHADISYRCFNDVMNRLQSAAIRNSWFPCIFFVNNGFDGEKPTMRKES